MGLEEQDGMGGAAMQSLCLLAAQHTPAPLPLHAYLHGCRGRGVCKATAGGAVHVA